MKCNKLIMSVVVSLLVATTACAEKTKVENDLKSKNLEISRRKGWFGSESHLIKSRGYKMVDFGAEGTWTFSEIDGKGNKKVAYKLHLKPGYTFKSNGIGYPRNMSQWSKKTQSFKDAHKFSVENVKAEMLKKAAAKKVVVKKHKAKAAKQNKAAK